MYTGSLPTAPSSIGAWSTDRCTAHALAGRSRMTRVLVTGATGFIGSSCLPRLVASRGPIHSVSSRPQGLAGPPGSSGKPDETVKGDQAGLLDPGETARLLDAGRPPPPPHPSW